MSDLSITAASVAAGTSAVVNDVTSGATITAGQLCYLDSSNQAQLTDADAVGTASITGIALNGASSGQPIRLQLAGNVNPGATVAVGTFYVGSTTPGAIALKTDLGSGDFVSFFGVGTTSSNIVIGLVNSEVAIP